MPFLRPVFSSRFLVFVHDTHQLDNTGTAIGRLKIDSTKQFEFQASRQYFNVVLFSQ